MDLSQIISIAGKPGLYRILNQSRGGVIVLSLQDGKKTAIGQTQRVSALSDISMYTVDGDLLLDEILKRVHAHTGGKTVDINVKDDGAVRDFFTEVIPEHDQDRVYNSDIRKLIKWYNSLLEKDLLDFEKETDTQEDKGGTEEEEAKDGAHSEAEPADAAARGEDTEGQKEA